MLLSVADCCSGDFGDGIKIPESLLSPESLSLITSAVERMTALGAGFAGKEAPGDTLLPMTELAICSILRIPGALTIP